MNNICVYCEYDEGKIQDVSFELLTKGRSLANQLGCRLEALVIGENLDGIENEIAKYGADIVFVADDKRLQSYSTLPHAAIAVGLFKETQPQIALMGATSIGRDLGPRISSALSSGLTADCTELEIGEYEDKKAGVKHENLLYQIRPAFGGNIIAWIVNPDNKPQMATVREGVMRKEILNENHRAERINIDVNKYLSDADFVVKIIERHIETSKINLKNAPVIIAGGYGVGSKENFELLHELAHAISAEVGASRAAVDAGFTEKERQIGQTGITVRPKLYIACGISGQIQHIAGMQDSAMVISINNDLAAPINKLADYVIHGDIAQIVPKMIKYYKKNVK
jgi:electron transfer flavoprotein alpha subunit